MRSSLSCHLKSISGLLIVVFIFATLPVCRVAALETASISEYAKPYATKRIRKQRIFWTDERLILLFIL